MNPPCIACSEYPGGVLAMDSGFGRPRMAACWLVEDAGEVAVIETGTNASVPRLLALLERRGWDRGQVRWVVVTHVHLDHAGGAGLLMQSLPNATLLVHPRGAPHMVDPARLEAGVRAVYGDAVFEADYGALVPVPAARVRTVADGERVPLGAREFRFRDTPGHARHHFCVHDPASDGWFTGDTFGLSYRELDTARGPFTFPTTTPVQFDPPALKASLDLLAGSGARWMYLTHYGRVGEVPRLADDLRQGVDRLVEIARRHADAPDRGAAIRADMLGWLVGAARSHGVTLGEEALVSLLESDVALNTQGLEHWLDHG